MQPLLFLLDYYFWRGLKVAYFSAVLLGSWVVVAAKFIKVVPLFDSPFCDAAASRCGTFSRMSMRLRACVCVSACVRACHPLHGV